MHFGGWLASLSLLPYLAREIFYPAALDEEASERANVRREVLENSNFMNAFLEERTSTGATRTRADRRGLLTHRKAGKLSLNTPRTDPRLGFCIDSALE